MKSSTLLPYRRQHTHKHAEELPDDSIKYRLEYENNGLLINDRLFQRQLFRTQTESVIDTLSILNRINDSHLNPAKIQLTPLKKSTHNDVKQNMHKYLIQRNQTHIDLKANLNEELQIVPNWSLSSNKLKNSSTPESDVQSTSTEESLQTKRFIKSRKITKPRRLRNLLDNGVLIESNTSFNTLKNERTTYPIFNSDSSNSTYLSNLNKLNSEKQIKQVDAYKKFKAELGFSFSRRLPNSANQLAPSFLIRATKC